MPPRAPVMMAQDFIGVSPGWMRFLDECVAGWAWGQDFLRSASTDAHTASRVRGSLWMPFLCRSKKKGRKKRNSDVPSETSLPADAGLPRRGVCTGKSFLLSRRGEQCSPAGERPAACGSLSRHAPRFRAFACPLDTGIAQSATAKLPPYGTALSFPIQG